MDLTAIFTQLLLVVSKLAPLSVVIAALALLHNFWQAIIKRKRDDAIALRETIGRLGVRAYILNWSLIGNSTIAAGILEVREQIETRVGKAPSAEEIVSFVSEKLLFESVIEKAWRDAKISDKF